MKTKMIWITLLALGLLFLAGGAAYAQASGYDLAWWTVDGGGGASAGGSYSLSGTIGQPDSGTMAGGNYQLAGGFWAGAAQNAAAQSSVFLPLIFR